jgi:hypothetical protein
MKENSFLGNQIVNNGGLVEEELPNRGWNEQKVRRRINGYPSYNKEILKESEFWISVPDSFPVLEAVDID